MPSIRTKQVALPGILDVAVLPPKCYSVFEALEVVVRAPLVDGAYAATSRVGVFTSVAAFRRAFRQVRPGEVFEQPLFPGDMVRYRLHEHALDRQRGYQRTLVLDTDGRLICESPPRKTPELGQPTKTCKYRLGDIVGVTLGDRYRLGIICEEPRMPETITLYRIHGTDMKQVYTVALVDPMGRSFTNWAATWRMMPPLTPPDAETIRQLRHRCARWGKVPAPRCAICGGGHGWCDPDDGLHALMRQYDLRPKTASWCQVADHMLADAEGIVKRLLASGWQRRVVGISDWCGRLTVTPELQDEPAAAQLAEICAGYEVGEPEDR